MKVLLITFLTIGLSAFAFGQDQPSKKMPPLSMLKGKPGEKKTIFELPHNTDYKIFNQKGKLIASGNAEFIDLTKFKKGTYFITFDEKRIAIQKD